MAEEVDEELELLEELGELVDEEELDGSDVEEATEPGSSSLLRPPSNCFAKRVAPTRATEPTTAAVTTPTKAR